MASCSVPAISYTRQNQCYDKITHLTKMSYWTKPLGGEGGGGVETNKF
jgi:hypothetical protein